MPVGAGANADAGSGAGAGAGANAGAGAGRYAKGLLAETVQGLNTVVQDLRHSTLAADVFQAQQARRRDSHQESRVRSRADPSTTAELPELKLEFPLSAHSNEENRVVLGNEIRKFHPKLTSLPRFGVKRTGSTQR